MAELTQSVSNEKVSTRWEETYVSRGINRQMSVIPPGLYAGGDVDYSTTTTLRIAAGKYVVQDTANGFGMILRDPDATEIDCSSLFPVATQKDWYVGLRITYTTGSATTCEFFMTDVLPLDQHFVGKDELVFCQVTLHAADTGLNQATITPLVGASPKPYPKRASSGSVLSTDRDLGLLDNVSAYGIPSSDEKDALVGYPSTTPPSSSNKFMTQSLLSENYRVVRSSQSVAITGNVKFQLNGTIYVGTGSASEDVRPLFELSQNEYDTSPFMASGAMVTVDGLRTSDDLTVLVPSTHADSDGFYDDPWVYLTSSAGSIPNSTIRCLCMEKKTALDDLSVFSSLPMTGRFVAPHAESSYSLGAGSPSSEPYNRWTLSSGDLQSALEDLLAAVNETQIDLRAISGYKLVYRSGGYGADSSIPVNSISVYMGSGSYVVVSGAYINGSDHVISSPAGTANVNIFGVRSGGFFMAYKSSATASTDLGTVISISAPTTDPWDKVFEFDSTYGMAFASDSERLSIYAETRVQEMLTFATETAFRLGYASQRGTVLCSPDYFRTWILQNATYDASSDNFSLINYGGYGSDNAMGIGLRPYSYGGYSYDNVFAVGYHDTDEDSEPWTEDDWRVIGGFYSRDANGYMSGLHLNSKDISIPNTSYEVLYGIDGLLMVKCDAGNEFAVFGISNQSYSTQLIFGNTGYWSDAYGTPSRVNVGYSGSSLRLQNNSGATAVFRVGGMDLNEKEVKE
jgi:hypothetical protein